MYQPPIQVNKISQKEDYSAFRKKEYTQKYLKNIGSYTYIQCMYCLLINLEVSFYAVQNYMTQDHIAYSILVYIIYELHHTLNIL